MVSKDVPTEEVTAFDWESVGIGKGTYDIFLLMFHVDKELRRKYEMVLLDEYYNLLITFGVSPDAYSKEQCYNDYVYESLQHVIFRITALEIFHFPDFVIQFYNDQMTSFMTDHNVVIS